MTVTTTTLATLDKEWTKDVSTLAWKDTRNGRVMTTRASLGGSVVRALTLDLHAANGCCIYCGGMTNAYGEVSHPDTAALATRVPCVLTDEDGGVFRCGYVAGNVGIAHAGCIAAANAYGVATGEPVVMLADAIHPNADVPTVWPRTRRASSSASDPDASEALRLARVAVGLPF